MGWGRVDGSLHSHPKIVELAAMRCGPRSGFLWLRALSYCAEHATDGRVSLAVLRALGGSTADAARLVLVGLWEERGEEGYVFHDWGDCNPTGAEIRAHKARKAKNQRELRERRAKLKAPADRSESEPETPNVTGDTPGDLARARDTDPTRPDPTRPDPSHPEALRSRSEQLCRTADTAPPDTTSHADTAPPDTTSHAPSGARPSKRAADVRAVFDTWVELHWEGSRTPKLNAKRRTRIEARLREGYSVEDCQAALRGALNDAWLMGRDRASTKAYRDVETLLRDGSQLERLAALDGDQPNRALAPHMAPISKPDPLHAYLADNEIAMGTDEMAATWNGWKKNGEQTEYVYVGPSELERRKAEAAK